jgi:hypothetical protein
LKDIPSRLMPRKYLLVVNRVFGQLDYVREDVDGRSHTVAIDKVDDVHVRAMEDLVGGEEFSSVCVDAHAHLNALDRSRWHRCNANHSAKFLPVAQIPSVLSVYLVELMNQGQPNGLELVLVLLIGPLTGAS